MINNEETNSKAKKSELKLSSNSFIPKGYADAINDKIHINYSNNKNQNNLNNMFNNFYQRNFNFEKNKFDNENISNKYLSNNAISINDKSFNKVEFNINFPNLNSNCNEMISCLLKESKTIKISLATNVKTTISSILEYLEKEENETVHLTGLNLAISKVILIAEIVKVKIRDLHQINNMDCLIEYNSNKINKEINDKDVKRIPKFDIILTKKQPVEKGFGYQSPLSNEEIEKLNDFFMKKITNSIKERKTKRNKILVKRIFRMRIMHRRKKILILFRNKKKFKYFN